jgi:cytochrome c
MTQIKKYSWLTIISGLAMIQTMAAVAEGDPVNGKEVFQTECTACHNFIKGAKPDMYGVVLPLYGIVGAKAAQVKGFFYSKALRESGLIWDEKLLDEYIEDPMGTIPGIRMQYAGLKDKKARTDMIAYFKDEMAKNQ